MKTKRWAIIYGVLCVVRTKGANGILVAVIDTAKSFIGASLLFGLNRLSYVPTLVTWRATPSLRQLTNIPRQVKEKEAMQ